MDPSIPSSVPPDLEFWLHHGVRAEDTGFPPETPCFPAPTSGLQCPGRGPEAAQSRKIRGRVRSWRLPCEPVGAALTLSGSWVSHVPPGTVIKPPSSEPLGPKPQRR